MTGKNWDFQKIITLVLNVLELHPWSGFEKGALAFSYKLLSLSLFPGIIRNIYKDVTEKQIKMSINAVYTNAEIDVFKREEKFTGTVKVLFKSEDELKSAMADPIKIASQRCIVDEYEIRPRVIKCNNCQKFGHIARLCRSKTKCGKCARGHETRSCTITDATKFICAHCDGNHSAGYRGCEILQSKEADLQLRSQYGS